MILGHLIGEFVRAAYRRWKSNQFSVSGVHYRGM
jgi:hypothetical protein